MFCAKIQIFSPPDKKKEIKISNDEKISQKEEKQSIPSAFFLPSRTIQKRNYEVW